MAFEPEERIGTGGGHRPIRVQWLGTAGFRIEFEQHVVLIDPYLTRASLGQCFRGPVVADADAIARLVPRADAILVGHTHFDHALDVPAIARSTGAHVYGSWSAAKLCLSHQVPPDQVHIVERGASASAGVVQSGPMRIRFVPSAHSGLLAGRAPFPGELEVRGPAPMRVERYRCGAVFNIELEIDGRRLVHMGSARLLDDTPTGETDLLMLCAAGWRTSRGFPERVVRAFAPRTIVLSHWDDFTRPLDEPARPLPTMGLESLARRIQARASRARIGTLDLLGSVII